MRYKLYGTYDPEKAEKTLSGLSLDLLAQQKKKWPLLAQGYEALSALHVRDIQCSGFSVRVQWNPQRIVSSGAKVDPQSIKERKCFLCKENLPSEQKCISYRENFVVLCNPAPIFSEHYTLTHIHHTRQGLYPHVKIFFDFAKEYAPRFSVFYNGAECGASAPDHMHFQACPSSVMPIERDSADHSRREHRKKLNTVNILTLKNYGREVIILEGDVFLEMAEIFQRTVQSMRAILASDFEPMMNLILTYTGSLWRLIIIPRRKHRPEVYFLEGDRRVMISPAAVDLGGLIITPVEKDFRLVDARMVETIFTEVTIQHQVIDQIIQRI